jgi:hypothetical protein
MTGRVPACRQVVQLGDDDVTFEAGVARGDIYSLFAMQFTTIQSHILHALANHKLPSVH